MSDNLQCSTASRSLKWFSFFVAESSRFGSQSDRDERQGTDAVGLQLQFLTCMAMASTFEFIPEKIVPNFVSDQGLQFVGGKHRQSRAGDLGRLDAPAIRYEPFFAVSPDEKTTFYVKRKTG